MKQFTYIIKVPLGIHARPAGQLARIATAYADTIIIVTRDGNAAKITQLMKLMSLTEKQGSTITVVADGFQEDAAIAAMWEFCEENL